MRLLAALALLATAAFAATAAARPALTKSQARAIVRDVNLKASDLPGYDNVSSDRPSAADRQSDARLARCYGGVPQSKALATGDSPVFVRGNSDDFDLFGSIVAVFPKPAFVRKDLKALRGARARECMRSAIEQAAGSGGDVATVTATTLQTAVRGVFGYRFRTQIGSGQPVYSDFFFMGTRSGEARVIVNASPTAPAQRLDDRVVRIVKTRLDARLDPDTVL
jgi:hypothetical protein